MHFQKETIVDIELNIADVLKNIINKKEQYTIPIFIPHEGCKNECVFCNQRKISGKSTSATKEQIIECIDEYLEYFKNQNKEIEVAFFGGSFTGINIKKQQEFLKVAYSYIVSKKINGIRLSTRPDYISPVILKLLKKYGVTTIELGVQSMNEQILKTAKRGHTTLDVIRASRLIRMYGFNLGHQIMVGLPESSTKIEIETIKKVIKLKPSELRIYPVYVIPDSNLYDMYKEAKYTPLKLEEAVDKVYDIMNEIRKTDIRVIRLGLQSTEQITTKNNEIKGPVCDNFAEYVLAKMIREEIKTKLINFALNKEDNNRVNIITDLKYASIISGPKRINKKYFKEEYNINLNLVDERDI